MPPPLLKSGLATLGRNANDLRQVTNESVNTQFEEETVKGELSVSKVAGVRQCGYAGASA